MVISLQPSRTNRQELLSSRASSAVQEELSNGCTHASCLSMLLPVGQLEDSVHHSNCRRALRRWRRNSCIAERPAKSFLSERKPLMIKSWCGRAIATANSRFPLDSRWGWDLQMLGGQGKVGTCCKYIVSSRASGPKTLNPPYLHTPTAHDSLPPLLLPWPLRIGPASLSSPQLVWAFATFFALVFTLGWPLKDL